MSTHIHAPRWFIGTPSEDWGARPLLIVVPPLSAGPEKVIGWLGGVSGVNVVIVQVPGRGERLFEEPMHDLSLAAAQLTAVVGARLPRNWALLGMCSGCYIALELTQRVLAYHRAPRRLFLCNSRPPGEDSEPDPDVALTSSALIAMTDEELYADLAINDELLTGEIDLEIRQAAICAFRAAVSASASYRWNLPPLDVATEVWRGGGDDVFDTSHARAWQSLIVPDIDVVEFAVGREDFYLPVPAVVQRIRCWLCSDNTS